jgi:hypothetical protein
MNALFNFLFGTVDSLRSYGSHPVGWALLLVTGFMGLQKWTWWAPAVAAFMAALIVMDDMTLHFSLNRVFGSSEFYRMLPTMIILGCLGYAAGRLVARVR